MNTTRERILDVSKDIFREFGYSGAGIQQIIAKAGIPRGSLYYHFPMGKEELALEVLHNACKNKSDQFKDAVYHQDIDKALYNIVQIFIDDLVSTNYKYACPVLALSISCGDELSKIERAAADTFNKWEQQLKLFYLKRKVENGEVKASIFLSAIDGAFAVSKLFKNTDRLTTIQNNIKLFY